MKKSNHCGLIYRFFLRWKNEKKRQSTLKLHLKHRELIMTIAIEWGKLR